MSEPTIGDAELVAHAAQGDAAAFEALYRRHHVALFRTALGMTGHVASAEDLLQDAFIRAYRHVGRVQLADGASLRPWLHRIVVNLARDRAARRAMATTGDRDLERIDAGSISPERSMERREVNRIVAEAVDRLPFDQRLVVVLFYTQDMDVAEIAATLGIPPGTVKSRLYYGRARLRAALAEDVRMVALPSMEQVYNDG
ncbi:MAG: sigma-70 family RNA polymerase sigma factor [Ardenticatenales bacterium]